MYDSHILLVKWCIPVKWFTPHNTKYLQARREQFKSGEGGANLIFLTSKEKERERYRYFKNNTFTFEKQFLIVCVYVGGGGGHEPFCSLLHLMKTLVV